MDSEKILIIKQIKELFETCNTLADVSQATQKIINSNPKGIIR